MTYTDYHRNYYKQNIDRIKVYEKKYRELNKDKKDDYDKSLRSHQNSFCGNYRMNNHNNLLRISMDLFS